MSNSKSDPNSKSTNRNNRSEALAPLPESSHKFWRLAEKEQITLGRKKKCRHYFIRRSGREVECQNCHAGFFLDGDWDVKGGYLYKGKKKIVL